MAELVAAFIMPHPPHACAAPDAPPADKAAKMWAAYDHIVGRLRALAVDTVIVIGDSHYSIHGPSCLPQALIGIGEVSGPVEPWLNTPMTRVPNDEPLAHHILRHGHTHGVDWATAKAMVLDHSCYVPWHYGVRPAEGVAMIPVYLSSGVDPFIPTRRAYEIGQEIGRAVATFPESRRVAVFGTGGVSHWPGMAGMGSINIDWDQQMIRLVLDGNIEGLCQWSDADILREGGNGGLEVKNWACAMGAFGATGATLIEYEPVYEWFAGCAFAELEAGAPRRAGAASGSRAVDEPALAG